MESLHLVVLWKRSRKHKERILMDLSQRFVIVEEINIQWPWWKVPFLLRGFYSDHCWVRWFRKGLTCGAHAFSVVLIKDETPEIAGENEVGYCVGENKNMRVAKQRYRSWCGRWSVHASATQEEAVYQFRFLTGCDLLEYIAKRS